MFSKELHALVEELDSLCQQQKVTVATAESCTGGLLGAAITEQPGVSQWFFGSFVTYSNDAKKSMLHVSSIQLVQHGAVSAEVAESMVIGVFDTTAVDLCVSITGIAGPDGGTADKPVGTVWFAWGHRDDAIYTEKKLFEGDRQSIRQQSACFALQRLIGILND